MNQQNLIQEYKQGQTLLMEELIQPQIQCAKSKETCSICKKNQSKYQCPKCEIAYCSIQCFKNHSEKCVKKFFDDIEKDKLRGIKADYDTQKETRKMLNKMYREFEEEPIEAFNEQEQIKRLETLLAKVDIGIDELTLEEQRQFSEFILSKTIDQYISKWSPWWEIEEGTFSLFVEEDIQEQEQQKQILDDENLLIASRKQLKQKLQTIIPFNKLKKQQSPHPDIDNHLTNIIMSIALLARSFNGEQYNLFQEFYSIICNISSSFREQKFVYGSLKGSLDNLIESALRLDQDLYQGYTKILMDDALKILSNKFFTIETLFNLYEIFQLVEEMLMKKINDQEQDEIHKVKNEIKLLSLRKNKLLYFISLTKSKDQNYFQQLKEQIQDIIQEKQEFLNQNQVIEEIKNSKIII